MRGKATNSGLILGRKQSGFITLPSEGFANPLSATDRPYRRGDLGHSFAPRAFRAQVAFSLWAAKTKLLTGSCEYLITPFLTDPFRTQEGKL